MGPARRGRWLVLAAVVIGLAGASCSYTSTDEAKAPTTTLSVPDRLGPAPALDLNAPRGSRSNPYAMGGTAELGGERARAGWSVAVVNEPTPPNPKNMGGLIELQWNATPDRPTASTRDIDLSILDAAGRRHTLGGDGCWAMAANDRDGPLTLHDGGSSTTALCWSVSAADQVGALLQAYDTTTDDVAYLEVAQ